MSSQFGAKQRVDAKKFVGHFFSDMSLCVCGVSDTVSTMFYPTGANCTKTMIGLPGGSGQSGLTVQFFPVVILANQLICQNNRLSNENAFYN